MYPTLWKSSILAGKLHFPCSREDLILLPVRTLKHYCIKTTGDCTYLIEDFTKPYIVFRVLAKKPWRCDTTHHPQMKTLVIMESGKGEYTPAKLWDTKNRGKVSELLKS